MNNGIHSSGQPTGYWALRREIFDSSSGSQTFNWNRPEGVREILVTVQAGQYNYSYCGGPCVGTVMVYTSGQARTARIVNPPSRVVVTVNANANTTSSFGDFITAYNTGGSISPSAIPVTKTQTSTTTSLDVNGLDSYRQGPSSSTIQARITVEYLQWVKE